MNDDFTDAINKFKDVLASKNIDISDITSSFANKKSEEKSSDFDFDIETIIKLKNIISSANNQASHKIKLLEDLKPFLNSEWEKKLDELIKLAKIVTVIEILNKNGGLNLFNL